MKFLSTKIATKSDFKKISKFIATISKDEKKQCIHTSIGETPTSLEREFVELYEKNEILCNFVENESSEVIGFLACEFDKKTQRGWLKGPLAIENNLEIYQNLLWDLNSAFPFRIKKLFAFPNLRNKDLINFYLNNDFQKSEISYVFEMSKSHFIQNSSQKPNELFLDFLPKENQNEFIDLHEEAFPKTYYSAKEILGLVDENHKILTMIENRSLLGYIFLANDFESEISDLEFIAVNKSDRGKGVGRKLISSAITYAFLELNSKKVTLNVTSTNNKAKKLYEKIGFKLLYSGLSLKRQN